MSHLKTSSGGRSAPRLELKGPRENAGQQSPGGGGAEEEAEPRRQPPSGSAQWSRCGCWRVTGQGREGTVTSTVRIRRETIFGIARVQQTPLMSVEERGIHPGAGSRPGAVQDTELQRCVGLVSHPMLCASAPLLAFHVSSRRITAEACGFVAVRPHVPGSVPPCSSQSLFRCVCLRTDFNTEK